MYGTTSYVHRYNHYKEVNLSRVVHNCSWVKSTFYPYNYNFHVRTKKMWSSKKGAENFEDLLEFSHPHPIGFPDAKNTPTTFSHASQNLPTKKNNMI